MRLVWYSSAHVAATVYRRTESASWSALGVASTDGSGQITFEDPNIVPGERYAYRLGIREGAGEVFARETWVEVPRALELSLEGLRPNPAVRDIAVTFTPPRGDDARIEWLDVTGRRVRLQSLVGPRPGTIRCAWTAFRRRRASTCSSSPRAIARSRRAGRSSASRILERYPSRVGDRSLGSFSLGHPPASPPSR